MDSCPPTCHSISMLPPYVPEKQSGKGAPDMKPQLEVSFFETPASFRAWLEKNHARASELWVAFYKKGSGRPSITWPESVDQALCFGWIDGIRKNIDEVSYKIRFTPRRPRSVWSAINIRRVEELQRLGLMAPAGLAAFAARLENRSGIYSYEQRKPELDPPYQAVMKKNKKAWAFWESQPPSYRKMMSWWIVSAKKEETRLQRLAKLVEESANAKRMR